MNPRAATNDLLPFQGSPFNRLGTSPHKRLNQIKLLRASGERGIRTLAPFRTNGFQDRLVMTTSIPLHNKLKYIFAYLKAAVTVSDFVILTK